MIQCVNGAVVACLQLVFDSTEMVCVIKHCLTPLLLPVATFYSPTVFKEC